jgi:hypothetical protein
MAPGPALLESGCFVGIPFKFALQDSQMSAIFRKYKGSTGLLPGMKTYEAA